MMTNFDAWWLSLPDETREQLMDDPFGLVPLEAIRHDSPSATATWWPATQDGPAGFEFAWATQCRIELERLRSVERRLKEEKLGLLERYFPVGDGAGQLVVGTGFPDVATRERYYELEDLIRSATEARRGFILETRGMG